jgi:hypothetical protein
VDWRRGRSSGVAGDRFRKLVTAVDAAPLHAVGRLITRQELQRSLRTRLLLAQAWEREPAIRDESIARSGATMPRPPRPRLD